MNDLTGHDTTKAEKPHRKELPGSKELPRRIAFLLRMWCVDETGSSNWRASLEMPGSGKRIGFASLEGLFVYLIELSESRNDVLDPKSKE